MSFLMNGEKSKEGLVRSLGIFELRGLARELGVQSPTTKKREELVDLILGIVEAGEEPASMGKRKGRPFKKLSSIEQITATVTSSWVDGDIKPTYQNVMCFAQTLPDFAKILNGNEQMKGYVRSIENAYSFFDYDKKARVFIKQEDANFSKLSVGDYVETEASPLQERGKYVAEKIIKINGIDAENYEPYIATNGDAVLSTEKLSVDDKNIFLGRRNALKMKDDLYETPFLNDMLSVCNERGINLIVLALNTSFENMLMFKNVNNCSKFVSEVGSDARFNLDLMVDCINYAYNCNERGEKVVLFAPDIMHSLKAINECFDSQDKEIAESTDVVLQKLMALAKYFESGKSATDVLGYYDLDLKSDYFIDKILKVCKNCE